MCWGAGGQPRHPRGHHCTNNDNDTGQGLLTPPPPSNIHVARYHMERAAQYGSGPPTSHQTDFKNIKWFIAGF